MKLKKEDLKKVCQAVKLIDSLYPDILSVGNDMPVHLTLEAFVSLFSDMENVIQEPFHVDEGDGLKYAFRFCVSVHDMQFICLSNDTWEEVRNHETV